MIVVFQILLFTTLTIAIYQAISFLQKKLNVIWLNPMLGSILTLIAILSAFDVSFPTYQKATQGLSGLLEAAIVALGFPLYQHLDTIKKHKHLILISLFGGVVFVVPISFISAMLTTNDSALSVSMALKSITTPIGLTLTEQLQGNQAVTAFAIVIAGLAGAMFGLRWLSFLGVHSVKAQGLAMGAASHALGTATLSQISYQHTAYSSIALITSAIFTALISPSLIPLIQQWL